MKRLTKEQAERGLKYARKLYSDSKFRIVKVEVQQ